MYTELDPDADGHDEIYHRDGVQLDAPQVHQTLHQKLSQKLEKLLFSWYFSLQSVFQCWGPLLKTAL
jgi:hypothetical protein